MSVIKCKDGIECTFHYEWRIMNEHGLLVKPEERGSYHEPSYLNQNYSSEQEAIEDWYKFNIGYTYIDPHEMTLIKIYDTPRSS